MGLSGILSLLKGLGKGAKSAFTPIATQKTPVDKFLHLQRRANAMETEELGKVLKVAEKEAERVVKEMQALTNELRTHTAISKAGGHTPQSHARKAAEFKERMSHLEKQRDGITEMLEALATQAESKGVVNMMNTATRENYRLEKAMGLTKGALVGAVGTVRGD